MAGPKVSFIQMFHCSQLVAGCIQSMDWTTGLDYWTHLLAKKLTFATQNGHVLGYLQVPALSTSCMIPAKLAP